MSKKANNDLLEMLHGELAKQMLARLQSGEATAADLSAIRSFLNDNHIQADPVDQTMRDLKGELEKAAGAEVLPFGGH